MTTASDSARSHSLACALILGSATSLLAFSSPVGAATHTLAQDEKKVLTVDDYGRWRQARSVTLSPDGTWAAYTLQPNDGDGTLTIAQTAGEEAHVVEVGSSPRFSATSQHVTYFTSPGEDEAKKLRDAKKPVPRTLVLMDLTSGETLEFENGRDASFRDDGLWLAVGKSGSGNSEDAGTDLLVHDVANGTTRNFGNVTAHAWAEDGDLLAFLVGAADDHGNGLYLFDPETESVRAVHTSREKYSQLTWSEEGEHLACLCGVESEEIEQIAHRVVVVRDVGARREQLLVHGDPSNTDESGDDDGNSAEENGASDDDAEADNAVDSGGRIGELLISSDGNLRFSADGDLLFLGVQHARPKREKADERPDVDVWHHADQPVQSIQARRANRERSRTYLATLHLDDARLIVLADETLRSVQVVGDGRWTIGRDTRPYEAEITWGGARADLYRVDPRTGERSLITEALGRPMGTSPDGRHTIFLKGGLVWIHDLDHGTTVQASAAAPVDFVNHDDDHPYEKPTFGVDGWSEDGKFVILRHRHDLWRVPLDGSAADVLTAGVGERERIRFRTVVLDPDEEWLDLDQPLLLSAFGTWSKKSGFFRLAPGAEPQPLVFEDRSYGRAVRAEDAETVAISRQTFEEAPDWWITDTGFAAFSQLTDSNPQQAEYHWGRRVLIEYENAKGRPLQATLTLPADYVEGQRYPMLVYFYERMSDRHHQYSMPRFDDRPQMSTYASDGYLVLMPDVVYEIGRPGSSAVDCVTAAAKKAIDLGFADPERVALQGHSWGGYQSSFILTQTDMFCAIVTGAPVTNLVSFHGELYKSIGSVQQGITEVGQVRMGTTPWENWELYKSQSPLHNVRNITTPFVILHGTEDGAVDWHQGLEYYNAARRNGKEVILLSYPGEGHHLNRRPNQIDFQVRMKQFFDHYCKGTEAPEWMVTGVPYLERDFATPRPEPEPDPEDEDEDEPETTLSGN